MSLPKNEVYCFLAEPIIFSKEEGLMFVDRVLSGMRPTGALHLGHYQGVLKIARFAK